MNKSALIPLQPKIHVAILLDGNGRWAASRGLARSDGHRMGVAAVRRVVQAAPSLGIGTLTLYAFSSDNWGRPAGEVISLLGLVEEFLRSDAAACASRSTIRRATRFCAPLAGCSRAWKFRSANSRGAWAR